MLNEPWKISRDHRKVYCFVLILFLWIGEFHVGQGSKSKVLSDNVQSEEKLEEVQKIEGITVPNDTLVSEMNYTRPSVPKCCKLNFGYTFENKSLCTQTEDEFLPDFEDRPDYFKLAKALPVNMRYEYYIGDPCQDGKYILDPTVFSDDEYSVYSNGTLLQIDELYSKEEFCLETLNGTVRAFLCFGTKKPQAEMDFTFSIYAIGLIISIPFLLLTAFIYLCVDQFRNIRGKSLSCHVLCLAIGYLFLAIVQLASDHLNESLCITAGFVIQFFFVASFFWLNVICFDTWRCINNEFRCNHRLTKANPDNIIFCCYSLYGWYGPVILTIITLIMDLEPAIPESYLKPNFGLKSCWFYSDDAALPYFYGPVALVILVNIILFFMSAKKIFQQQKLKKKLRDSNRNSLEEVSEIHNSVRMYIKILKECIYLFCIMGINWAAEVTSWAVGGSQAIWLITDIFNALQGIVIFYLFVLKPKRIREELKRRICVAWKKITRCDCQYKEENERSSRHWHAKFIYKEPYYNNEKEMSTNNDCSATESFIPMHS